MIYLVCLIFTLAFILTVSYILTRIKSVIGQAIKKKRRTSCYHTPQKESKSVASPFFYRWPCQDEWFRTKEVASCGGKVLCALTLARTVSEEELEQELYIPYTLEDRLSELQQTTAKEPVRTDDTPVVDKDIDLKV